MSQSRILQYVSLGIIALIVFSILAVPVRRDSVFDAASASAADTVSYTHLTLPTIYSV